MATIDEFLETGRLGSLSVGMNQEDVRSVLGEPEATGRQKHYELWKYGALQVGFHQDPAQAKPLLTTINLYFHDPDETLPEPLEMSGPLPTKETTLERFRPYISGYSEDKYRGIESWPSPMVTLDSGVKVAFDEGRLYAIFWQPSRKPEGKQLTLFLPKPVLDVLRREASEQRVSMSDLCVRWVKERAEKLQETGVRI